MPWKVSESFVVVFMFLAQILLLSLSVEPLRFKLSCPVCHSQLGSMNIYYILYIILYIYILNSTIENHQPVVY